MTSPYFCFTRDDKKNNNPNEKYSVHQLEGS